MKLPNLPSQLSGGQQQRRCQLCEMDFISCDLIYDIPLFQNAHIDVLLFRSGDAFYIRINFSGNGIVNFRFIHSLSFP